MTEQRRWFRATSGRVHTAYARVPVRVTALRSTNLGQAVNSVEPINRHERSGRGVQVFAQSFTHRAGANVLLKGSHDTIADFGRMEQ
jgi:hypothetical protein